MVNRFLRFSGIVASFSAMTCSACLRFVPPRSVEPGDVEGEAEFFAIERQERNELQMLLDERAPLLRQDAAASYQVSPRDLVDIRVFDLPELTVSARVRPDGMIAVPLIGDVMAQGLSETELQRIIAERLRRYIVAPAVTVAINSYEGRRVSVIGEVAKPGVYPLRQGTSSLVQILSEAGGRTARAAGHVLLIPANHADPAGPPSDGSSRPSSKASIEIDIEELLGTTSGTMPVHVPLIAGDTIVIPEAGSVQVDGEVVRPGSYPLSSKESMVGALAAAGGVTYSADVEHVEVIREVGSGRKAVLACNLQDVALKNTHDIRLRNGDVVRIPSAQGRFMTRQVVEVLNRILNVNVVQ